MCFKATLCTNLLSGPKLVTSHKELAKVETNCSLPACSEVGTGTFRLLNLIGKPCGIGSKSCAGLLVPDLIGAGQRSDFAEATLSTRNVLNHLANSQDSRGRFHIVTTSNLHHVNILTV